MPSVRANGCHLHMVYAHQRRMPRVLRQLCAGAGSDESGLLNATQVRSAVCHPHNACAKQRRMPRVLRQLCADACGDDSELLNAMREGLTVGTCTGLAPISAECRAC